MAQAIIQEVQCRFYTVKQMCQLYGVSRTKLWTMENDGDIPRGMKRGHAKVWFRGLVDTALADREQAEAERYASSSRLRLARG